MEETKTVDETYTGENYYHKEKRIGSGTFGVAYLVKSLYSGKKYVMKEIYLRGRTQSTIDQACQEAKILARCKHVNIVRYREVFLKYEPLTMCLVMEYADGGDLAKLIRRTRHEHKRFPERKIIDWFVQMSVAVHYLHRCNIIHRDLKPSNIFLTKSNVIKVGDFGISTYLVEETDAAKTAVGTLHYMSPERCRKSSYDSKADIWALGCILYELCGLRPAFSYKGIHAIIPNILQGQTIKFPSGYSEFLRQLVSGLLRTVPQKRPTMDQLIFDSALTPFFKDYLKNYDKEIQDYISANPPTPERVGACLQEESSMDVTAEVRRKAMEYEVTSAKAGPSGVKKHSDCS